MFKSNHLTTLNKVVLKSVNIIRKSPKKNRARSFRDEEMVMFCSVSLIKGWGNGWGIFIWREGGTMWEWECVWGMNVCVCVCERENVCVYVCMCVWERECVCKCVYVCVWEWMCVCVRACACLCAYVCVSVWMYMC